MHKKDERYHRFPISKGNGKLRWITAPNDELKEQQIQFLNEVLYTKMPHSIATGFVPGKSIFDNAVLHVNQKIVVNIDIRDFFGSTKEKTVRVVLKRYGFSGSDLDDKVHLCCWMGELPQGSPASPHVANMALYSFDEWLFSTCQDLGLQCSRYADDITISGDTLPKGLVSSIRQKLKSYGYRIAEDKVHIRGQNSRQLVTGLVVNKKVQLPRSVRKWLRAVLHRGETLGYQSMLDESNKDGQQIMGYIGLQALYDKQLAKEQVLRFKSLNSEPKPEEKRNEYR